MYNINLEGIALLFEPALGLGRKRRREGDIMDYKKSYLLFRVCLYAGMILCIISLMIKISWPGMLGIVIVILGISQTAVFYRCPNCHKALNFRGRKPKYCPECGFELDFK